jgi:hypothetical protein
MRGPKPVLIKTGSFSSHPTTQNKKEVQTRLEKKKLNVKLNVVRTSRTCTKRLLF